MADTADTFEAFVAKERERLTAARADLFSQQEEIQKKLDAINREMLAIDAYAAAKAGKPLPTTTTQGGTRRSGGGRRGGKREELLALIKSVPGGLSRGEILDRMQLKGDKSGEQSVSNALSSMKKAGQLTTDGSKYQAA